jgi:hypothetical protein
MSIMGGGVGVCRFNGGPVGNLVQGTVADIFWSGLISPNEPI